MPHHPDYCDCHTCVTTYWGVARQQARDANVMLQAQAQQSYQHANLLQNVQPSPQIIEMTRQATTKEPEPLYTEFDNSIGRMSSGWNRLSLAEQEKVKPRAPEKTVARKVFESGMSWGATITIWLIVGAILTFAVDNFFKLFD